MDEEKHYPSLLESPSWSYMMTVSCKQHMVLHITLTKKIYGWALSCVWQRIASLEVELHLVHIELAKLKEQLAAFENNMDLSTLNE
jgi:hypothetical protein